MAMDVKISATHSKDVVDQEEAVAEYVREVRDILEARFELKVATMIATNRQVVDEDPFGRMMGMAPEEDDLPEMDTGGGSYL